MRRVRIWQGLMMGMMAMLLGACAPESKAPSPSVQAGTRVTVVASFSILADVIEQIGGERVQVHSLMSANQDAHTFEPKPQDVARLRDTQLVVSNGLGFEPWLDRWLASGSFAGRAVVATAGMTPLPADDHADAHEHGAPAGGAPEVNPHVWMSPRRVAQVLVPNITAALSQIDPVGAAYYAQRAQSYQAQLLELDTETQSGWASIAKDQRRVIVPHQVWGYYAADYAVEFTALQGVSTEAQVSARRLAELAALIQHNGVRAIFPENVGNAALMQQLARETKLPLGAPLITDALTAKDGEAGDYVRMMRLNNQRLWAAVRTPASAP